MGALPAHARYIADHAHIWTPPGGVSVTSFPTPVERLSRRELEVLALLYDGASNADVARELVISIHTVKRHVANLLAKLGVPSRARAVARARKLGLV